jgi:hypothetical protein
MENQYLTEESKKEIIKVLVDEYEKILISETVSKSNNSALKKKQIEEFVNYLQTNENIEINEVRKAGWGTAIGQGIKKIFPWLVVPELVSPLTPQTLDPIGIIPDIFVGPGGNSNPAAYPENRPDFKFPIGGDPDLDPEAPYPRISPAGHEYSPKPSWGNNSGNQPPGPPQNLPESIKAFWKNRLNEKINQND